MLLQYPDDLLFRVPALLHTPSSRLDYERTPASIGRDFRGQVNWSVNNFVQITADHNQEEKY
jgi:hypothetical protein